jgi:single-strand DNA-binding protein
MRYTPQGTPVTSFGLAINREFSTKTGEKKEETCFVNLVVWGKRGEIAAEYLKKGSLIFVEGRLTFRSWETQDKEKRSTLEVNVDNFQFLERAGQTNTAPSNITDVTEENNVSGEKGEKEENH